MNQNINNFSENDYIIQPDNKIEKNKNKKLILIIVIILSIVLLTGGFIVYNILKDKNVPNNDDDEIVEVENQLWYDFNNGLIDADEYIRTNIYNNYDKSLLPEKYASIPVIKIDNLITKYYDELSEDTIKLYLDYYSLSNISFKVDDGTPTVKPLANTIANETTVNLNNVYLSSNGNFLIWYTNKGNSAVDYSYVQKYAELLENIIIEYDNIFGLNYSFKSAVLSKGKRYNEQLEVLNEFNIDEKYLTDAMHVYIYDLNLPSTAGMYCSMNESNNALVNFINNYLYSSEDGTIITPYILLNSVFINDSNSNFEDTIAHEVFHHYQDYIINNTGRRNSGTDTIIGEATAQWAAAKITKNESKNNSLNIWVSNYIKHTGDIFTDMYDSAGTEVGYAMFKFLYSYENNVSNGMDKIFKAIHSSDGFKYLNDNATIDERNKVMVDLALKNLNNDYPNNNYLPKENDKLVVKKEIVDDNKISENVILSSVGIDYYLFNSNLKHNYKIKINAPDRNWATAYVIGLTNGKYEILLSEINIKNSISIDTENYQNYEKLYIVITNNDFDGAHNYEIDIEPSTIKNETTFNTNFNNYKIKATSTMVMYGMETISYINGVVDELHQKEYLETTTQVMGFNVSTSSYVDFAKGYTYTQNPLNGTWEKAEGATSLIDLTTILDKFKDNGNITKVNSEKYLVKLTKDDIKGLLKYNSNLNQYNLEGDIFVTVYIKDNYVSKLEYDFSTLIAEIEKFTMVIEFYDHNNAGDVSIPAEATR